MKRLLTLILTFILTISGVFPAFAAFSTNTQTTTWKKPDGWSIVSKNQGTQIESLAMIVTGTHKEIKGYDFVLPVYVYDNGNGTPVIGRM